MYRNLCLEKSYKELPHISEMGKIYIYMLQPEIMEKLSYNWYIFKEPKQLFSNNRDIILCCSKSPFFST